MTFSTGLSDFHKMKIVVLKSSFMKLKVMEAYYRNYKKFSSDLFSADFALSLDHGYKDCDSFEDAFMKTLNGHASMNEIFIRVDLVPYVTKTLRKQL